MTVQPKPTTKTTHAASATAALLAKPPSKSALVLRLLSRAKGATIAEIAEPTGWQPHSTRAYLSGLRKKGRTVVREQRKTGETAYRIVDAANPSTAAVTMPIAEAPPTSSDGPEANASVDGNANANANANATDTADAAAATDQIVA